MADTDQNTDAQPDLNTSYADAAEQADKAQEHAEDGNYQKAGAALDDAQDKFKAAESNHDVDKLQEQIKRLEADNRKLKDENGDRRVTAKKVEEQNATLKKVAQLLGYESDDDDPEKLLKAAKQEASERAKERDELQAKLDRLEEDAQLRKVVERAGGNAEFVVPFLRGAGLPDWGSEDWESKVTQRVKETLERYTDARANRAPRSSGNAPTPTPGGQNEVTREDLESLAANGEWDKINELSEKLRRR